MTKATNSSGNNIEKAQQLTAANLVVLRSFLKHCNAKPDFKEIANECGMKNAPRDVNTVLGKLDLGWKAGTIYAAEDAEDAIASQIKKGGAGKKRKAGGDVDEAKAGKKAKAAKKEDDAEEYGEDDSTTSA